MQKFCTRCGKELLLGNNFCVNCGEKYDPALENEEKVNEGNKSGYAMVLMSAAVLVLIVSFIVAGGKNTMSCGNGTLGINEECDDGNHVAGDGCSQFCENEMDPSLCGNGKIDSGESCDDGNNEDGDGCSALCNRGAMAIFGGNKSLSDEGKEDDACEENLISDIIFVGETHKELTLAGNMKVYGIVKNNSSKCYAAEIRLKVSFTDINNNLLQEHSFVMLTEDKNDIASIGPGKTYEFNKAFKVYESLISETNAGSLYPGIKTNIQIVSAQWNSENRFSFPYKTLIINNNK